MDNGNRQLVLIKISWRKTKVKVAVALDSQAVTVAGEQ